MATTTQQLVEIALRAVKANIKTGDNFADYVRKHAPKLAETHVSHLYLAFRIVRKPEQYGAALAAIKRGSPEALSKLVKACQRTRGNSAAAPRTPAPARKGASVDARLAAALGLDEAPAAPRARKRRADPAPNIAQAVYDEMVRKALDNARKATRKKD
jgi:hypothetical protein